VEDLKSKIAATERERDDLKERIADRRSDVEEYEDAVARRLAESDLDEESVTDAEGSVAVDAVESETSALEDAIEDCQERINDLSVEIGSKSDEVERLEERLAVLGEAALVGLEFAQFLGQLLVRLFPVLVARVDGLQIPLVVVVSLAAFGDAAHTNLVRGNSVKRSQTMRACRQIGAGEDSVGA